MINIISEDKNQWWSFSLKTNPSQREKCPNTELFSVFFRIQSEYRKIRTRSNSAFGHFLRSANSWRCETLIKNNKDIRNFDKLSSSYPQNTNRYLLLGNSILVKGGIKPNISNLKKTDIEVFSHSQSVSDLKTSLYLNSSDSENFL